MQYEDERPTYAGDCDEGGHLLTTKLILHLTRVHSFVLLLNTCKWKWVHVVHNQNKIQNFNLSEILDLETQIGSLCCAVNIKTLLKVLYENSGHISDVLDFKIDSLHNKNIINKM